MSTVNAFPINVYELYDQKKPIRCLGLQPQKPHPPHIGTGSFPINVYRLHEIEGLARRREVTRSFRFADAAIAVPEPVEGPAEFVEGPAELLKRR